MPLHRRLPKYGMTKIKKNYKIVNLRGLERMLLNQNIQSGGIFVLPFILSQNLSVKNQEFKLLSEGDIYSKCLIYTNSVSEAAREKVKLAGGDVICVKSGRFSATEVILSESEKMKIFSYTDENKGDLRAGEEFNFCVDVVIDSEERDLEGEELSVDRLKVFLDIPEADLTKTFHDVVDNPEKYGETEVIYRLRFPLVFQNAGKKDFALGFLYDNSIVASQESSFVICK